MKKIVVHDCRLDSGTGDCVGRREAFHLSSMDGPRLDDDADHSREAHRVDRGEHPA